MMFDIGWSELLVIGVVALVVIGPKDLPKALKTVGIWMRKARQISGEFRASLDQMVREAELDEVREQVKKAAEIDLDKEFAKTVDPTGSLAESLRPPDLDLTATAAPKAIEPPAAPASTPAENPPPEPQRAETPAPEAAEPQPAPAAEPQPAPAAEPQPQPSKAASG
jgi:sec-independent protein translocase protein TatB